MTIRVLSQIVQTDAEILVDESSIAEMEKGETRECCAGGREETA